MIEHAMTSLASTLAIPCDAENDAATLLPCEWLVPRVDEEVDVAGR